MKGRPAMMPDGKPHPFVWYGKRSPWIETTRGVFRCHRFADGIKALVCKAFGCAWKEKEHSYSEETIRSAEQSCGPVFLPRFTLVCNRCGSTAMPWKIWTADDLKETK